jgi:uncharacterized protein (UPF0261 family)
MELARSCAQYENRWFVRTTAAECDRLGQEIAFKASAGEERTSVLIPCGGLSVLDVPGGPFRQPDANKVLFQSLRNWIIPTVSVHETPLSLADPAIADVIVESFCARFRPDR